MKQTIFWRAKAHRVRLETGDGIRFLPASLTAPIACPALWTDLGTLPQLPGSAGRRSLGCPSPTHYQARVAVPLLTHHTVCSGAHRANHRSTEFPPCAPRPYSHVTLTLQARRAKKIFIRESYLVPTDIRETGCNGGQTTPIFWQNASVSYAVEDSIDCMMLNRNIFPDFPYRPGLAGLFTHVTTRGHSTGGLSAAERGAS